MLTSIYILTAFFLFLFFLYHRASLKVHTTVLFILTTSFMVLLNFSISALVSLLFIFTVVALSLNTPSLRMLFLTGPIFREFKKKMPAISPTEEEAIEAGPVWWDGELFSGKPDWDKFLRFPAPKLSAKEKAFLDGPVEELCSMLNDWEITQELQDLPQEAWEFIKQNRFFGMIIPEKYGGLEFSALAHSEVIMKVASRSISAAVTIMVPNSLGPAELLLRYGTEKQKEHYLPRLATGQEIPCFALTGPEAGSDAASIPDTGVVSKRRYNGKDNVTGILLNWEKRYITLGPVATVLGLAFRLYDPENILGETKDLGITLALIPADTPGIEIGNRHFTLDAAFQVGPNSGENVFIPIEWIIGGKERAGHGWQMLMNCLAEGRSISLPALSTASSKLSSRFVGAYARIRKQFKVPIGTFEGVEEKLARIAGNTYISDSARIMTAGAVDQGQRPAVISAIVKYNLTELARDTVNDAMDILGGAGICMGPRNILARIYQSIPISITVEGSNVLTRNMITFGQGVIRCHPYLLHEIRAARGKYHRGSLQVFDSALTGHVSFTLSNAVRSFVLAIAPSLQGNVPGPSVTKPYIRNLTRMSAALALTSDISMLLLGGKLKRRERISARLADVLSNLYLASSAIKKFIDDGSPESDLPLLRQACSSCLFKTQESLFDLYKNFPVRAAAALMRFIVFPTGRSFKRPLDLLDHEVAGKLLSPSETRDRLTRGIFIPENQGEPLALAETALSAVINSEPSEKKVYQAAREGTINKNRLGTMVKESLNKGIIEKKEANLIVDAMKTRKKVIKVDDFPKDRWRREKKTVTKC